MNHLYHFYCCLFLHGVFKSVTGTPMSAARSIYEFEKSDIDQYLNNVERQRFPQPFGWDETATGERTNSVLVIGENSDARHVYLTPPPPVPPPPPVEPMLKKTHPIIVTGIDSGFHESNTKGPQLRELVNGELRITKSPSVAQFHTNVSNEDKKPYPS